MENKSLASAHKPIKVLDGTAMWIICAVAIIVFYALGSIKYLYLLFLVVVINYFGAIFIEKAKQSNGTIKIGRPSDYRKPKEQYFSQYQKEIDFLLKGELSLRQIHTVTGTSVGTLQKIKHLLAQTATVPVANEIAQ